MNKNMYPYRYSTRYSGVIGEALTIQPVGMPPEKQNRFNAEVQLITISIFGEGYAANTVYTSYPPVVFQHTDMRVNRERAKRVMKKWRELKHANVNILKEYREFSPARRVLKNLL